jgi:lipopolysaccharide transport system permease protein
MAFDTCMIRKHHLNLLAAFTLREVKTRFSGSVMGPFWVLIGPLAMLGIYGFVFGNVFRPSAQDLGAPSYLIFVAAGLWPWMMFSEGLTRGMSAIQSNASLVRKVSFPHAILVFAAGGAAMLLHLAGYCIVLLFIFATSNVITFAGVLGASWTVLWLLAFTLGLALLMAGLQTLLRDIEQAVTPTLMMLYFLTPVLYPATVIPLPYRDWLVWNPLSLMIMRLREQLFVDATIRLTDLIVPVIALLTLWIGYAVFARLSPHFEDFL